MKASPQSLAVLVVFVVVLNNPGGCLHVVGTWRTGTFFHFISKFGFQKTNLKDLSQTQGYIYGNITAEQNLTHHVSLAVLDRGKVNLTHIILYLNINNDNHNIS